MDEMENDLDRLYMTWLYKQYAAATNKNPARSYWNVTELLYTTPFIWRVANDDNRAVDGQELREEFIVECEVEDVEIFWLQRECSMLEMLVALARRASFEAEGTPSEWFGKFLDNMGIRFSDKQFDVSAQSLVNRAAVRINYRKYESNGEGGLFPLRFPTHDQREVELWYQLSAYLLEGGYIDHGP